MNSLIKINILHFILAITVSIYEIIDNDTYVLFRL